MLEPRHTWVVAPTGDPSPALLAAGARSGLSARVVGLLHGRGVRDDGELARFIGPAADALHDPHLLPDADPFLERIGRARERAERVMVLGDFDADGLTGLAVLVLALRRFGIEPEAYVPDRVDEGHGLSSAAVERAVALGITLIVTVDCGSSSGPEVDLARTHGIDVIVTDHHRVPEVPPAAVAFVNAHRPDSRYPDSRLTGAGVAFRLATLLIGRAAAADLADLAMIGTVADVAPIVGENRAIARLGLEVLRAGPRPGLAAILERAGIAAAEATLETVGFAIAPRLNAAGRIGVALDAARLLLATEASEAAGLAASLEAVNRTRRDLTTTAVAEARLVLAADGTDDAPAILVRGPWPVGIVGLVAARLAEEHGRPAVVGSELGETIRASCRSDGGLDLAAALTRCGELLIRHGGHAGAAGLELRTDDWQAFLACFLAEAGRVAGSAEAAGRRRPLAVDLVLPALDVDYGLLRELSLAAPYGTGHPEPLVAILGLTVTRARAATGGHTQVTLRRRLDVLDGIAFGWPELAGAVGPGDRLDVVARLVSRRFGGYESLQLDIRDAAPAGSMPLEVTGVPDAASVAV